MKINQPKKGSALVWAHDLVRQLNLSEIPSRSIREIMSRVTKREIPLPNGKHAYLVDYNEFIDVAEEVMHKKVSNYVRDVDNFKKVVHQEREQIQRSLNKEQAIKDAKKLSELAFKDYFYRKSLYMGNNYSSAYWAAEIEKASIPNYFSFPTHKSSIVYKNYKEIPLDEGFVDYLAKESFKKLVSEKSRQKKPIFSCEKFLSWMGLGEELKLDPKEKKKKVIKNKKIKEEKELSKFSKGLLNLLQLSIEDEDDFEESDVLLTSNVEEKIEEKQNKKIISFDEKRKQFKSVKQRNKDVKYKIYLLCQKLNTQSIHEFSLNEKLNFMNDLNLYKSLLKKENKDLEYENDYALLIINHLETGLKNNLNSFNQEEEISKYARYYLENMKDAFDVKSKNKIIDFKISKETRNKLVKTMGKVASFALILMLGIGSKGMNSDSKDKEIFNIEKEFTDEKNNLEVVHDRANTLGDHMNERRNLIHLTTERKVDRLVLEKDQTSELKQDYCLIDEEVQVNSSEVYSLPEELANNVNARKPYYTTNIDRKVRSIIVEDKNEKLKKVYSNEEVDHYLSLNYDVIGYEIVNDYSFDENGYYVFSEGIYASEGVTRKLEKKD